MAVGLLGALLLWRRPRPAVAFGLVLALNLAAWAAYVAPFGRLYALGERTDRAFAVGMAACIAAGNPVLDHVQVGFAALEPFWNLLVAALALFRPQRILHTYHWLAPLSLVAVGLGFYFGLRGKGDALDAWERFLMVFAVLGLASFSMSQRTLLPALWAGSFLGKPNHAMGWGLLGATLGFWARGGRWVPLGLLLGLLAWAFLLGWAYLAVGLVVGTVLRPRAQRRWKDLLRAVALSLLIAAPYVVHLARDYNPLKSAAGSPKQIWREPLGQLLAAPHWGTLDLGPLLILGLAGAWVLARRRTPRDADLLGLLAVAWGLWAAYEAGALVGFTPKPDQSHYFLRLAMALAAGSALAAGARYLEEWKGLQPGQGHVLAMAVCLPFTFHAYWDPPSMDRYYKLSLPPLGAKVVAYGEWVRESTPPQAVFLAGESASTWIPVLTGRRVLLAGAARPPADYRSRKEAERVLLTSKEPEKILATARRFGVTHLAIDGSLSDEYGEEALAGLGHLPVYEPLYFSSAVRILRVRSDTEVGAAALHPPPP